MTRMPWQEPYADHNDKPYQTQDPTESYQYRACVQSFSCAAGYEAVVRVLNRRWIEDGPPPRKTGCRKKPDYADPENLERARRRAKTRIRHLCKNISADHMTTCTTREQTNTPASVLRKAVKAIEKYEKVTREKFEYVMVPEAHPTNPGHFHVHIAHAGFLKLHLFRQIWWAVCGGRGLGNVDVRYFRTKHGRSKSHKIACYLSKYVTKTPVEHFNKKRYWASRCDLPEKRWWWLRAATLDDAKIELAMQLGLDPASLHASSEFFEFPDGTGFWYVYQPELHAADPPPF